jgi:hypothetical protein
MDTQQTAQKAPVKPKLDGPSVHISAPAVDPISGTAQVSRTIPTNGTGPAGATLKVYLTTTSVASFPPNGVPALVGQDTTWSVTVTAPADGSMDGACVLKADTTNVDPGSSDHVPLTITNLGGSPP